MHMKYFHVHIDLLDVVWFHEGHLLKRCILQKMQYYSSVS